jgi:hypothetical protein
MGCWIPLTFRLAGIFGSDYSSVCRVIRVHARDKAGIQPDYVLYLQRPATVFAANRDDRLSVGMQYDDHM